MEFTVNKQNYFLRIFRGLIIQIILAVVFFIHFYKTDEQLAFIGILIPMLVVIISFLRFEHWYRYYIIKILIKNEKVFCELLDRNKTIEQSFKISDLEVILDLVIPVVKNTPVCPYPAIHRHVKCNMAVIIKCYQELVFPGRLFRRGMIPHDGSFPDCNAGFPVAKDVNEHSVPKG